MNFDDREMLRAIKRNEEIFNLLVEEIKIRLDIKNGNKLPRFPNYKELLFKSSILEQNKMCAAKAGDEKEIKYLKKIYALKIYTKEEILKLNKGDI